MCGRAQQAQGLRGGRVDRPRHFHYSHVLWSMQWRATGGLGSAPLTGAEVCSSASGCAAPQGLVAPLAGTGESCCPSFWLGSLSLPVAGIMVPMKLHGLLLRWR